MNFPLSVTLPFDCIHFGKEFVSMAAVQECARTADQAGFCSGTVTDHPVPSGRWLDSDGHFAHDPFVMLSLVAAVTVNLRVQTNILVLPYRNPFITARAVSSLDAFSNGRVVLGLGAGHLKPEFKALGVDFDRRNSLTDEYITAMKLAWTGEEFSYEGTGYAAAANRLLQRPVQEPHPQLLIGGNSKRALRRAIDFGDAWHPFIVPKPFTDTVRTASISNNQDIISAIEYMRRYCDKVGRQDLPKVISSSSYIIERGYNAQGAIDHFCQLQLIGVHGSGVTVNARSRSEWCDLANQVGDEVIKHLV